MLKYVTVTFKNGETYNFNKKCEEIVSIKENNLIFFKNSNGEMLAAIPAYEIRAITRSDHMNMIDVMKGEK